MVKTLFVTLLLNANKMVIIFLMGYPSNYNESPPWEVNVDILMLENHMKNTNVYKTNILLISFLKVFSNMALDAPSP